MNIEIYSTSSEEETFRLGADFSSRLSPGDVIAFYGDIGVGKTEFIKGICSGMNVHEIVASPTFTIINQYDGVDADGDAVPINHIDLYRVESPDDLVELGLEEILADPDSIKLIEWAENAGVVLPPRRYDVCMYNTDDDSDRRIEVVRREPEPAGVSPHGRMEPGHDR